MRQNVGSSYFLFDQNQPFEIIVRLRLLSNIIYSIFYLLKDLSSIFTEFVAQNFSNKTKLKICHPITSAPPLLFPTAYVPVLIPNAHTAFGGSEVNNNNFFIYGEHMHK